MQRRTQRWSILDVSSEKWKRKRLSFFKKKKVKEINRFSFRIATCQHIWNWLIETCIHHRRIIKANWQFDIHWRYFIHELKVEKLETSQLISMWNRKHDSFPSGYQISAKKISEIAKAVKWQKRSVRDFSLSKRNYFLFHLSLCSPALVFDKINPRIASLIKNGSWNWWKLYPAFQTPNLPFFPLPTHSLRRASLAINFAPSPGSYLGFRVIMIGRWVMD